MQLTRHIRILLCAVACLSAAARPLCAEENAKQATAAEPIEHNQDEPASLSAFLDQHPVIEARLAENTALVDNAAFLKNHPQLAEFLEHHPEARQELATNPRLLLHRELARSGATKEQIEDFDHFLDQHPALAKQLAEHPHMLKQTAFADEHPELREYFKQHPSLSHSLEQKPTIPAKPAEKVKTKAKAKAKS